MLDHIRRLLLIFFGITPPMNCTCPATRGPSLQQSALLVVVKKERPRRNLTALRKGPSSTILPFHIGRRYRRRKREVTTGGSLLGFVPNDQCQAVLE